MKNKVRKTSRTARDLARSVDTRQLRNNTQRVLRTLLAADGQWVSRSSLRVPSASSRVRDLRTSEFGSMRVECATARELGRKGDSRRTFYRLVNPSLQKAEQVLKGVVVQRRSR